MKGDRPPATPTSPSAKPNARALELDRTRGRTFGALECFRTMPRPRLAASLVTTRRLGLRPDEDFENADRYQREARHGELLLQPKSVGDRCRLPFKADKPTSFRAMGSTTYSVSQERPGRWRLDEWRRGQPARSRASGRQPGEARASGAGHGQGISRALRGSTYTASAGTHDASADPA
jgi:hypothetical protein